MCCFPFVNNTLTGRHVETVPFLDFQAIGFILMPTGSRRVMTKMLLAPGLFWALQTFAVAASATDAAPSTSDAKPKSAAADPQRWGRHGR